MNCRFQLVLLTVYANLCLSWICSVPHARYLCRREICLQKSSSAGDSTSDDDRRELLERASRLRQEALDMETVLRKESRKSLSKEPELYVLPAYQDVKDSVWTFSYRFSDQPEPEDEGALSKRTFYSGRLCLRFRADGYTDMISHEPREGETNALKVVKAWGWDLETSNDDNKDYLMFSIDALVPGNDKSRRFYFQARQDREKSSVKIQAGTVTIKQDIVEAKATPGMWGLFSPRGILAQFRYVGDFAVTKTLATSIP